jgi:hypothetical protein
MITRIWLHGAERGDHDGGMAEVLENAGNAR